MVLKVGLVYGIISCSPPFPARLEKGVFGYVFKLEELTRTWGDTPSSGALRTVTV